MDVNEINDLVTLKAMAYDELSREEVAQQNLRLINRRIAELIAEKDKVAPKAKKS